MLYASKIFTKLAGNRFCSEITYVATCALGGSPSNFLCIKENTFHIISRLCTLKAGVVAQQANPLP